MKIKIREIGSEGKRIVADATHEAWFDDALFRTLPDSYRRGEFARLTLDLTRIGETVQVEGEVTLNLHPVCARCADDFVLPLRVPIKRILVPQMASVLDAKKENSKENDLLDDIDFSPYEGDVLEIDPIFLEELVLTLPIRFLCRPECPGLCPRCGANLNAGVCRCRE